MGELTKVGFRINLCIKRILKIPIPNKKGQDKINSFSGHFLYSLGAIPSTLPYNAIGSYLAFFNEDTRGLPDLFGLLLIFYGVWNAINDLLLGYRKDTKKMKRGRRAS